MTAEIKEEPFAEAVKYIDDLLHPKGPLVESQPIQVDSVEQTVGLLADELGEQALKLPLIQLLHDFQDNPAVDGVGLVVLAGRHLSIRVLTNLDGKGEKREYNQRAIGERYDACAQSLYDTMPESSPVNWGLSYYNTNGDDASTLVSGILKEISKEVDASVVSFVVFERPTPVPQV